MGLMHIRLAVPDAAELAACCGVIGLVQLAMALRARALERRPSPPWPGGPPHALVVFTCKGVGPGLRENAASFLAQDYSGAVSYLYVVPKASDPAFAVLREVAGSAAGADVRVLASEVEPVGCSGQAADLAWAAGRFPAAARLLVFADADCRVGPDWLSRLCAPLSDPAVGVSTSAALPVPLGWSVPGTLRMLWVAASLPFFSSFGLVCGQSMALRKEDFERWGVAEAWKRCVGNDHLVARLAAAWDRRVRFVFAALPADREGCSWDGFWSVLNKWMTYTRIYAPVPWACGFALAAFKAACLVASFWPRWRPGLLAAVWAMDAVSLSVLMLWLRGLRPEVFAGFPGGRLGVAVAALVGAVPVFLVYLVNHACSLTSRVRWAGRVYRFSGPLDVEVEAGP